MFQFLCLFHNCFNSVIFFQKFWSGISSVTILKSASVLSSAIALPISFVPVFTSVIVILSVLFSGLILFWLLVHFFLVRSNFCSVPYLSQFLVQFRFSFQLYYSGFVVIYFAPFSVWFHFCLNDVPLRLKLCNSSGTISFQFSVLLQLSILVRFLVLLRFSILIQFWNFILVLSSLPLCVWSKSASVLSSVSLMSQFCSTSDASFEPGNFNSRCCSCFVPYMFQISVLFQYCLMFYVCFSFYIHHNANTVI